MSGGNCILYMVCGVHAQGNNPFCRLEIDDETTTINSIIESSVSKCVGPSSSNGFTVSQLNGNILCKSVNLSQNHCYKGG